MFKKTDGMYFLNTQVMRIWKGFKQFSTESSDFRFPQKAENLLIPYKLCHSQLVKKYSVPSSDSIHHFLILGVSLP
jgi:hypothetical protein